MNKYFNLLNLLATAPTKHLTPSVLPKFQKLADKKNPKASEIQSILEECEEGKLASEFALAVIQILWVTMLTDEGLTPEDVFLAKHED